MIELVARRFQVLGEPSRIRILQSLQNGAMTVNQIVADLDGNQPNISKHLQILFDAGLVNRERSGNSVAYSIADPVVFQLCELVCRSTARRAARMQQYAAISRLRNRIPAQKNQRRLAVKSFQGAD
jgi:DNA-binding transcriptional ArsR family regulator